MPQRQCGQRGYDAGGEDPAPVDAEGDHPVGGQHRDEEAGVPAGLQASEPDPPRLAGHELREHRLADGVLGADGEPEEQTEGQQLPVVGDDTLERAEGDDSDEVRMKILRRP